MTNPQDKMNQSKDDLAGQSKHPVADQGGTSPTPGSQSSVDSDKSEDSDSTSKDKTDEIDTPGFNETTSNQPS